MCWNNRIDYIVTKSEIINLLEVNTTPGMTSTSFIPQQVAAAGLSMRQVLTELVESAFNKCLDMKKTTEFDEIRPYYDDELRGI